MRKYLLSIGVFLVASLAVQAQQDIHFSQFWSNPLQLNPASTGAYYGTFRVINNYRSQWQSMTTPFVTISSNADMSFARDVFDRDYFSGGISIYNDKAGDSQVTTNNASFSFAYGKVVDPADKHYFAAGIQTGLGQRSLYISKVSWDNQYNGDKFDQTLPTGEKLSNESFLFFDVSGGLYYFGNLSEQLKVYTGVAAFHLNRPDISFMGIEEKLLMKTVIHGGAEIRMGYSNLYLIPNALYVKQGPNSILNFGNELRFRLKEASHYTGFINEASFGVGAYYRYKDAMIPMLTMSWAGFTLGMSYDINVSTLSVATAGKGGMEFMLKYRGGYKSGSHSKNSSERFL